MRAAVWYGKRDIRVIDMPEPIPGPGEVKIKVKACGICGSDIHEYLAGPIIIPAENPDSLTGKKAPVVLGHEFSGEIVEIGEGISKWKLGDRVVVDPAIACWKCYACKRYDYNQCVNLGCTGLNEDGAFAEYVVVREYQLNRLDDRVSWIEGAVIEPLAVGVHAVNRGAVRQGESVLISGAGPIGLATLQAVRASGAGEVYVVEVASKRKDIAKKMGATIVFDPNESNIKEEIYKLTDGTGVDISFECVGKAEVLNNNLSLTRKGGRVVVVGIFERDGLIDCNQFSLFEKDIVGCRAYVDDFKTVVYLLSDGRMQARPMITKVIKLEDIICEGFEELLRHPDKQIKIVVGFEE